ADSNSSKGFKSPLRLILLDLITEKTAAASVDEIIEPIKSPQRNETLKIYDTNKPTIIAVKKTPSVARLPAGFITGLTSTQFVSRPPANKINIRAITPIFCASDISLKVIPPTPSDPATIPTARKSSRAGIPALSENLEIVTLIKISILASIGR